MRSQPAKTTTSPPRVGAVTYTVPLVSLSLRYLITADKGKMEPPLTLKVERLSPHTILPSDHSPFDLSPVPATPHAPWHPPPSWAPSPTHNYPAPYGSMSLGGLFRTHFVLTNHTNAPVLGVKMMLEVQGPGGRYRLGEIIHGQSTSEAAGTEGQAEGSASSATESGEDAANPSAEKEEKEPAEEVFPELAPGGTTGLEVEAEMKELGVQVLICSVAWETPEGRRTFQRFLKFNVNAPLSIKTRIHTPTSPNDTLDPIRRGHVHLEVLMQNTSPEGLVFDRVLLEPVHGMTSQRISSSSSAPNAEGQVVDNEAFKDGMTTLLPNDSRQYLFLLSPSPSAPEADSTGKGEVSVFPPAFAGGTVLPLGRLDVAWRSGRYHDHGRLQTSTLNRRVPVTPISSGPKLGPTRTTTAIPPSPAGPSRITQPSPTPPPVPGKEDDTRWEFDLSVLSLARGGVQVDDEIEGRLRLGVRKFLTSRMANSHANTEDEEISGTGKPGPVYFAIQRLDPTPSTAAPQGAGAALPNGSPQMIVSPPSRANTPQPPSARPFTPGTSSSRPLTPVTSQLQKAASQHITSPVSTVFAPPPAASPSAAFPPPPYLASPASATAKSGSSHAGGTGEAYSLGSSMWILPPPEWRLVKEQHETTYSDTGADEEPPKRWESIYEFPLRWLALSEGLAPLGGLRALVLDDDSGLRGYVGREWDSLGDIFITS